MVRWLFFIFKSKTYFNFIHTFSLKLKKQNMKNWKDKIIGILSAIGVMAILMSKLLTTKSEPIKVYDCSWSR